ncbi:hypothetical protein F5Y17DRAFT_83252 [Xylariaceae sp. FL0594]|nr:hypothetical protein F5Y17DRAFT_83252 [Xylariaceae sp. FL0594]
MATATDDIGTLQPLTPVVRSGSIAIAVFSVTSFTASLALFVYLTWKVVRWQLYGSPGRRRKRRKRAGGGYRFESGPAEFGPAHDAAKLAGSEPAIDAISLAPTDEEVDGSSSRVPPPPQYPNQFIVLVVNLLVADLHQATAFALSISWLARDSIAVGTGTCWAQGLFISVGDLASSCFMSAIAIHTFYSIVYGYRPPHKTLYLYVASIWIFVYLITLLPVAGTLNGVAVGGYYVRAGAWCWVNQEYGNIRLLTHYIFIFIAIILSWVLYAAIFVSLRRQQRQQQKKHDSGENGDDVAATTTSTRYPHHPAFLVYPVIYLVCILPLAVGRVATMAGRQPPAGYFCFAGALVASNGWLDVILFATTRRSIVFAHGDDGIGNEDTGVDTFAFMHHHSDVPRKFGNTTWIRGGRREGDEEEEERRKGSKEGGGWWRILGDPEARAKKKNHRMGKTLSQTSLTPVEVRDAKDSNANANANANAIQMEVVTSVVVEEGRHANRLPEFSDSTSSSRSMDRWV